MTKLTYSTSRKSDGTTYHFLHHGKAKVEIGMTLPGSNASESMKRVKKFIQQVAKAK